MNIFDYANYYKDYTYNEVLFNEMDGLIYAILSYLPVYKLEQDVSIRESYE